MSGRSNPDRFIGLDIHKYYLVATAVDRDLNKVYGPRRIELVELQEWIKTSLNKKDAVVLEMSANSWDIYDELFPYVHSVTIVHPPHVALIVRAQVMTDKIAALHLARLHAKGLLTGVWVPPQEIRDLRTLVAQRKKMTAIKTQARTVCKPPFIATISFHQKESYMMMPIIPGGYRYRSANWNGFVFNPIWIPWLFQNLRLYRSKIAWPPGL